MSLIVCKECGNQVSSNAAACPNCGAKVPRPPRTKWWLWIPLALIWVLFVVGAMNGPNNTTELGEAQRQRCLRTQGDGQWRASIGVTLDTFCAAKGAQEAIKAACRIDPSKC